MIVLTKRFDITSNADTILLHRGDRSPLSWSEYLYEKYDDMYKELESLFVQYQYYLDNNDLAMINMLRNSKYLDAFTGKGQHTSFLVYDDKNQYGYYDNFPITRERTLWVYYLVVFHVIYTIYCGLGGLHGRGKTGWIRQHW